MTLDPFVELGRIFLRNQS